jgi:hypothetical protein
MITQILQCPNCHGTDIVKHGKSPEGKQRYKCRETPVRADIHLRLCLFRAIPSSETTDSGNGTQWQRSPRYGPVLHVSPSTVIQELKKRISNSTSKPKGVKATNERAN